MGSTCRGCRHLRENETCAATWTIARGEDGPEPEGGWCTPNVSSEFVLAAKLNAVADTCKACRVPDAMWRLAADKTERGHTEHDDADTLDPLAEVRKELADIAGYGAIARLQGKWSWRWRLAGWLAGVIWMVLR